MDSDYLTRKINEEYTNDFKATVEDKIKDVYKARSRFETRVIKELRRLL